MAEFDSISNALKTLENQRFLYVFRGYENRTLTRNGLTIREKKKLQDVCYTFPLIIVMKAKDISLP